MVRRAGVEGETADELWQGRPLAGFETTLRSDVSRLRSALGASVSLTGSGAACVLDVQSDAIDSVRFERLLQEAREAFGRGAVLRTVERSREALSLWRGEALADVADDRAGLLGVEARAYRSETHALGRSLVSVPVVSGGKGVRQRADSRGAVSTAEVASIRGSAFCAVTPTDVEIPAVARLRKAAGYTADIGDTAWAEVAATIGTVCNRIYGSGSTNPASALAALQKITPKHGGGGITVPTFAPPPPAGSTVFPRRCAVPPRHVSKSD